MTTVKKLTKIGNSYGIILPKQTLHLLGINPEKGCRISILKHRLTVEPVRSQKGLDEEVTQSMIRFMKRYRADLAKLGSSK